MLRLFFILFLSVYSFCAFSVETGIVIKKISLLLAYDPDIYKEEQAIVIIGKFEDIFNDSKKIILLEKLVDLFKLNIKKTEEFDKYGGRVHSLYDKFDNIIKSIESRGKDYLKIFLTDAKAKIDNIEFIQNDENIEDYVDEYNDKVFAALNLLVVPTFKKYKIFEYSKNNEYYKTKISGSHIPLQSEISVTLMWINNYKPRQEDDAYIFPKNYVRRGTKIDIVERICAWAQQGYVVNFWYDSEFLGNKDKDIENTKNKIYQTYENYADNIYLKDVRDLKYVKDNKYAFEIELPVYVRSDLLRVIAAHELLTLEQSDNKYFMHADLSIDPMSYDELITNDPKIIYNLANNGIVMSAGGIFGYENNFFIVSNKKNMLDAIELGLIKVNLKRINDSLLNNNPYNLIHAKELSTNNYNEQFIFDSYPNMMQLFYTLEGKARWTINNEPINKNLNPDTYYEWFGRKAGFSKGNLEITDKDLIEQSAIEKAPICRAFIPTKEVFAPRSGH